jgi:hemerythrin
MAFFTWDDAYSVQVKEMDDQHKRLFEIMAKLHTAMTEGKSNTIMAGVLDELHDYTLEHFTKEEKHLASFGYPGLSEQKKQHAIFVAKIKEYQEKMKDQKFGLSIELMNFLKDWLVNHIKAVDSKYAETFHSHHLN